MSVVHRLFQDTTPAGPVPAPPVHLDVTVTRTWLLRLVTNAASVIAKSDVMPVLKCVQISAADNTLTVIGTDTEVTLVASTVDVIIRAEGVAVLPAAKLLTVLRSADPAYVELTVIGDECTIKVGTAWWTMRIPSGADFPRLPALADGVGVSLDADAFHNAIQSVAYAAGKPTDRPGLDAVDIRAGVVTACDGNRFAQAPLRPVLPVPVTLPVAALTRIIRRLDGDRLDIVVADRHIVLRGGSLTVHITKLVQPYPDLSATLLRPALANRETVAMDTRRLDDAIDRVRISADPDTHGVALVLADKRCTVTARDPHGNTAVDTLECDWVGKARVLTVHGGHLNDLVQARLDAEDCADDLRLTLHLGEDTKTRRSPILCRLDEAGSVAVIQQMYLDWADALR